MDLSSSVGRERLASVDIDCSIVTASAEIILNTFSMPVGGCDSVTVHGDVPAIRPGAVAAASHVPCRETERPMAVATEGAEENSATRATVSAQVEAGHREGMAQGQGQRVRFAIRLDLRLDGPARHDVIGRIAAVEAKRTSFTVAAGPPRPRLDARGRSG